MADLPGNICKGRADWRDIKEIRDVPRGTGKIRQQVESGAKNELGRNKYLKKKMDVSYSEHERVKAELLGKEKALAEMGQEYLLVKKKVNLE